MTCCLSSKPAWSEPMATRMSLRAFLGSGRPQQVDQTVDEVAELAGRLLVVGAGEPDRVGDVVGGRGAQEVGAIASGVGPGQPGVDRLALRSRTDRLAA